MKLENLHVVRGRASREYISIFYDLGEGPEICLWEDPPCVMGLGAWPSPLRDPGLRRVSIHCCCET